MGPGGLTASVRSTSMAVSRGQALRPKSSTRCYRCLQLPISDPFLPFQAPDCLSRVWIHSFLPVNLWFIFQTVFYIPRAPQRNSLTTICELFPEGFLLPHLKPHNYSVNKISYKTAAVFGNWGQKAPASPREGAWCLNQLLFFIQHQRSSCPKATCPPEQSLPSQGAPMRMKK